MTSWHSCKKVYDFKDGKDSCTEYFSQAFLLLSTDEDITAMFMPCSTSDRYYRRFSGIASFLETHGYVRSGLDLICITESRECKHASEKRSEINTAQLYDVKRSVRKARGDCR